MIKKNKNIHCLFGIKWFITLSSTILENTFLSHSHNDVTNALKVFSNYSKYRKHHNALYNIYRQTPLDIELPIDPVAIL